MNDDKNSDADKIVGSSDVLYVLAGNYEQARKFAYSKGHHYTRMVSVDSREKVMGLRGKKLFVVGTAYERQNYGEILREAAIREFTVEHV